ncbi:hypothetical protein [Comamonas sp. 4034]|uniref:hypothetical protein n=1 Tax=Comamonas sp. 4034 TaxID=3156455 RepID=UPI003D2494BF
MESFAHFEVGDLPGRFDPGRASPGTDGYIAAKKKAGYPSCVLRLQHAGVFLPVYLLQFRPRLHGNLVTAQAHDGSDCTCLVDREDPNRMLCQALEKAEVWKERDNVLLLRGIEWDEAELQQWPQIWLCGPSPAEIGSSLKTLNPWLEKQYMKVKRPPYPEFPRRK